MTDRNEKLDKTGRIIPVMRTMRHFKRLLECPAEVAIVGRETTLVNLPRIAAALRERNKAVWVDLDLVEGIKNDAAGVDFLKKRVGADGLISTRTEAILAGRREGLTSVLKTFVHDEASLVMIRKNVLSACPDIVDLIPGAAVLYALSTLSEVRHIPLHVSGILPPEEAGREALFQAGIRAIHTGDPVLWPKTALSR